MVNCWQQQSAAACTYCTSAFSVLFLDVLTPLHYPVRPMRGHDPATNVPAVVGIQLNETRAGYKYFASRLPPVPCPSLPICLSPDESDA